MLKELLKEHEANCLVACRYCTQKMSKEVIEIHEEQCKPRPRTPPTPKEKTPPRPKTPP